ncbi:MAG: class I SAM-dependent methyltransferase [Alphaproteobacteria bacterium]
MNWRRLRLGLLTVTGLARRGFFIPYRYAGGIADRQPVYAEIEALLEKHAPAFEQTLALIDGFAAPLEALSGSPPAPRWAQDWFPRADGAAAYTMVRHHQPARVIEVGSGHSTRFMAQAVADQNLSCAITAIDPAPRATIDALPVQVIRQPVQQVGNEVFSTLTAGDVLFIDSSHLLMPGTDVDVLFNRVLPQLPAGVFVHIHDIFLPDDYPAAWSWRGYNEQLAVTALLQGGGFAPLWSSRYVLTRMKEQVSRSVLARLPLQDGAFESSLWLRKL